MERLLKSYFGYNTFRKNQKEIIDSVLKKKDTFVLMPTGGGKSICYQIPALKLDGVTLVISPLIALMKDQVDSLKANGVPAEFINSSIDYTKNLEIQIRTQLNEVKLLYIAPERLSQEGFMNFLKSINVSLIAIDEAHCISEWGHDFRPEYRNLKKLRTLFPETPVIALTATATPKVKEDIVNQLSLINPNIFISSFDRKNLNLKVIRKKESFKKILELLEKHPNDPSIIYCFSRKETEKLALDLEEKGHKAIFYHAGLTDELRRKNQELFTKDKVNIMVATLAFGMGIDKPNVRMVIHHTFPKTLEGYYQEIGRAGRDGLESDCILLYSGADERKHNFFISKMEDPEAKEKSRKKLREITNYAESKKCRRKYLLGYFGEDFREKECNACDFCLSEKETFDATEISKDILSAINLTENIFGSNYIAELLTGGEKVKDWHKKYFVYGKIKDLSKEEIKEIIPYLINKNLIKKKEGEYPTLSLTFEGIEFLEKPSKIEIEKISSDKEIKIPGKEKEYDKDLFKELRVLRRTIAEKKGVPPFIIFGDATLIEMASLFPKTKTDLINIKGIGETKLESFGDDFLEIINNYVERNPFMD